MNNILVLICVGLLMISLTSLITVDNQEEENNTTDYSGPVPLGYDVEHFRETGETILEGKI